LLIIAIANGTASALSLRKPSSIAVILATSPWSNLTNLSGSALLNFAMVSRARSAVIILTRSP